MVLIFPLQAILVGVMLGGLYAVVGLGMSLVFGVMNVINLAHGDLVVLSSYAGYVFLTYLNVDPILGLVVIVPLMFALGFVIQNFALNRVLTTGVEPPLMITFGVSMVLENIYLIAFSPLSRGITTTYVTKTFPVGPAYIPLVYFLDIVVAIMVMFFLRTFLSRTYLGMAIRAASQVTRSAKLMGINTNRVYSLTFGIAIAMAGVAGVFLGLTIPFTPQTGGTYLIIAFGTIIIGGLGSMLGTLLGGVVLGLTQTLAGTYLGTTWETFVGFLLILVVLTIRPQGLFGRKAT
ncbi:MAG TPA: branched-chain amino acid ABC transporter permease [Nitrososphaerales archaeon]|nr:branched-chain amino acid ABC transporter permease [Nitrososphaerales archaeon]